MLKEYNGSITNKALAQARETVLPKLEIYLKHPRDFFLQNSDDDNAEMLLMFLEDVPDFNAFLAIYPEVILE